MLFSTAVYHNMPSGACELNGQCSALSSCSLSHSRFSHKSNSSWGNMHLFTLLQRTESGQIKATALIPYLAFCLELYIQQISKRTALNTHRQKQEVQTDFIFIDIIQYFMVIHSHQNNTIKKT